MDYWEGEDFWVRDAGLFCLGFRAIGVDARFVALGTPAVREDVPLILCSPAQMEEASWWSQWGLEGVVVYSWALPRYTKIVRAIRTAGAKVVLLLDSDGTRSPRQGFFRHLHANYISERTAGRWSAPALALGKTLAALPNSRHRGTLEHLEWVDWIGIVSPLAKQRFSRFLLDCGRTDLVEKLTLLFHPVAPRMRYAPDIPKQRLILAVGGWDRLVKGAGLLVEVLGLVLQRKPAYRARIIGSGQDQIHALVSKLPAEVQPRILIAGPVPNSSIPPHYQEARILINTSYSEGASIAAAEALCCGCSNVGSALMSCFNYFCSESSGTLATRRSASYYCDALNAEIEAWERGERDPVKISQLWSQRLHAPSVARMVLQLAARGKPDAD
jgi:glycosyltransferase involved in cell wall biosynthesis